MKRLLVLVACCFLVGMAVAERQRVLVLTDIENEPDDAMSLVRFLTYSNQWDVEGLVATTSVHQKNKTAAWRIREIVQAYGKVQPNLLLHEPGYPTEDYLLGKVKSGYADCGMRAVGNDKDSEGSDWIINVVDKDDDRPVWVLVWGGPNCLAQALWRVRHDRTEAQLQAFVGKLRVYTVSDQDDSGPWLRKTFPDLFYIVSPGYHSLGAYHYCTWCGISGDKFHGRFAGADYNLVTNEWLDEHVRSKGPLGAQYPQITFLMEGDSPTFMYLINNGLSYSEHPDWGSWGGRYDLYLPPMQKWFSEPETRPIWTDAMDEVWGNDSSWHTSNKATIWRWREAYQNDFSARMDWTVKPYAEANHPPVVKSLTCTTHECIENGPLLEMNASVGDTVRVSAETADPDGNNLKYNWFCYPEAGTFALQNGRTGVFLKIRDADRPSAFFVIPKTARKGTLHIILAVSDDGTPSLTRYGRIVINVK